MLLSPLAEAISNLVQVIRDTLNAPINQDCGPMAGDARIPIQTDAIRRFQNDFKLAELLKYPCPETGPKTGELELARALQVAHEIVSKEGSQELRGLLHQLLQHQMYRVHLWEYDRKHYAVFVPVSERLLTQLEAAAGLPAAALGSTAGRGEAATSPADGEQNPYAQLAHILHDLYWLAWKARRKQTDFFDQINPITKPWDVAEQTARSTSASRGIPFDAFDPALSQARQVRDELIQVAAGNESVAFHPFDYPYTGIDRRLKELGMTWVGSSTAAPEPPAAGAETASRCRMTVTEANEKAMKLAKRMKNQFFLLSEREQAQRIGCSWQTWTKTPFYSKAKEKKAKIADQRAKGKAPGSPPVVSLTSNLEAVTGDGERDEELNRLIREQQADSASDPSPLDPSPRQARTRKRL